MIKRFCDLCGTMAIQEDLDIEASIVAASESDDSQEKTKCDAVVSANFSLRNSTTLSSGPIDLCAKCRVRLLHDLWAKAEDHRQMN